jgi:hypothetical protein
MTSHWNSVRPTIRMFDGRFFTIPDHVAQNWMNSGIACTYIKYAFCLHPGLVQPDDTWQYDDFWYEWIKTTEITASPFNTT